MKLLKNKKSLSLLAAFFSFLPFTEFMGSFEVPYEEKRWKTVYTEPLREDEISFQWLGTTGFKIQKWDFVLLIDPYLTRVPLHELFFFPLIPNEKILEEKILRADYIFVTDSHFDHFMDVPSIAKRTGAKVVGSDTTAKLLRLHNVPENQIIEVKGGETLNAGPFTVRAAKARHGKIWFIDPFMGDVSGSSKPPLRVWEYPNLENRSYHFAADGFSFFATSGTGIDDETLKNFKADIVIANITCLPEGYIAKLISLTSPKVIFPTHYDNYFDPYSRGVVPFPIIDLKVFCSEAAKTDPNVSIVTLGFFQEYRTRKGKESGKSR